MYKFKKIIFALVLSIILTTFGSTVKISPVLADDKYFSFDDFFNNFFDDDYNNKSNGKKSQDIYTGSKNGLTGEYYSNVDFKGRKFTRVDPRISFDWGTGSPTLNMNSDKFSVRWTGQIEPAYSEQYTFHAITDDGVRLWVNGRLIIDQWKNRAATEYEGTIQLSAKKKYNIKMEYFDYKDDACAKLLWSSSRQEKEIIPKNRLFPATGSIVTPTATPTPSPAPTPTPVTGNGLRGQYFDNMDLTDSALVRIDPSINFDWGTGSPDSNIGPNTFSVRWTGQVLPQYSETYTFTTISDDGVRLWVNNKLLIDDWAEQPATQNSGSIALITGQKYNIRLEYFDKTDKATVKLYWSSTSRPMQLIPEARLFN